MTSADRFDRRVESSVADLATPRFPDYFDDILAVTGRTRQRPAWTFPGRWIPMVDTLQQRAMVPRAPWRAIGLVIAVLLIAALAVAAIVGSQRHAPPAPFGVARNGLIAHIDAAGLSVTDPANGTTRLLMAEATGSPAFSLDGTHIAFLRSAPDNTIKFSPDPSATDLYVAKADGSDIVKVSTEPFGGVSELAWSPDGRAIAMQQGTDWSTSKILIAQADGSGITTLGVAMPASQPAWRPPDGHDLLFRGVQGDHPGLFLVHPDGTDLRALGAPGAEGDDFDIGDGVWSPDGQRIAYLLDKQDPYQSRIHAMNADGTGHVVLSVTPDGIQDYAPRFSPDGRDLSVYRWTIRDDGTVDRWTAILPADGSTAGVDVDNRTNSSSGAGDWRHVWSPDGSQLLATSIESIHVLAIDPTTGKSTPLPWTTLAQPTWQRLGQ